MGCHLSQNAFSRRVAKSTCLLKYQWNNDGFYSSKTVIFGEYWWAVSV